MFNKEMMINVLILREVIAMRFFDGLINREEKCTVHIL